MNTSHILVALDAEIARLQQARKILLGVSETATRGPGRPRKIGAVAVKPRHRLSAEARARIAAAQKARWAKAKKAAKS